MIEIKGRISSKGQVVIPKMFRETYKLYPNQEIVFKGGEKNITIEFNEEDIVEFLNKVSDEAVRRRKGKKFEYNKMEFYEQHDKRARRAGL